MENKTCDNCLFEYFVIGLRPEIITIVNIGNLKQTA